MDLPKQPEWSPVSSLLLSQCWPSDPWPVTSESEMAAVDLKWDCIDCVSVTFEWGKRIKASLHCWSVTPANQARLSPFCWPQRCNTSLCLGAGTGNLRHIVHGDMCVCMLVCACARVHDTTDMRWGRKRSELREEEEEEGKETKGERFKPLVSLVFLRD